MKDRIDVLDWDRLSTYDQDVLHLLAFVVIEMLVAPALVFSVKQQDTRRFRYITNNA